MRSILTLNKRSAMAIPAAAATSGFARKCNNGWMSDLQKLAKPILLPLIQGESFLLTPKQQKIVAAWCTMSVMTSDFFQPDRQAISHCAVAEAPLLPYSLDYLLLLASRDHRQSIHLGQS